MFKCGWYDPLNVFDSYIFSSFFHQHRFQNLRVWLLYVLLLSVLSVSCELHFGSDSGVLNVTYVDPESGVVVQEQLAMGQVLPGESEHVTGIVVHVSSNNHSSHQACQPLDTDTLPHQPFIALIQYGGCRDQVKLRHVAQANAAAALLYNDNLNIRFVQGNPIAFAVINQKKGEWLANLVENGTRVWMQIGVSATTAFRDGHINRTAVLFVSVSFIILMIFSFAWLLFYYIQRFRYIHAKEILSRHLCSAAKKALDKIPVKTVKTDDRGLVDDSECCAVCIEPFQHGELMRTLPCNHCFHKICIDPWLLEQRSCPMCKLDILLHFGLVYTGSQESVLEIDAEEFRRHRTSVLDHDIVLVPNQRRHSGIRVSISRDGAASPCSVTSLDPDASVIEHSYVTKINGLDGARNKSGIEYESDEEIWTKKRDDFALSNDKEVKIRSQSLSYEVCDGS